MRHVAAILLPFLAVAAIADAAPDPYATIPAGEFKSALRYEDAAAGARVAPFRLMRRPVTNADFRSFVRAHPDWERGRAPLALAEGRYLSHWPARAIPAPAQGTSR
jgi:formylglycine-generating enzyme required for sulfatase activity